MIGLLDAMRMIVPGVEIKQMGANGITYPATITEVGFGASYAIRYKDGHTADGVYIERISHIRTTEGWKVVYRERLLNAQRAREAFDAALTFDLDVKCSGHIVLVGHATEVIHNIAKSRGKICPAMTATTEFINGKMENVMTFRWEGKARRWIFNCHWESGKVDDFCIEAIN